MCLTMRCGLPGSVTVMCDVVLEASGNPAKRRAGARELCVCGIRWNIECLPV